MSRWLADKRYIVIGSILLSLGACGGGTEENTESDLISLPGLAISGLGDRTASALFIPWLATIRTFRLDSNTPGTGDADITTIQYNASRNVQQHIDWYSGQVVMDTCEITPDGDTGGGGGGDSSGVPYVSGGPSVVINAPNGTWYSIDEGNAGIYSVNNELPDAIPSGATLAIPGSVFPSVGAIPIEEPAVPVRISPESGPVASDSVYRWQAVGGSGVHVRLSFLEYDAAGNFIDFRISCDVLDDGEFDIPEDIQDAIANNSNTLIVRYSRDRRRLDLVEGIVAFSRISVAE